MTVHLCVSIKFLEGDKESNSSLFFPQVIFLCLKVLLQTQQTWARHLLYFPMKKRRKATLARAEGMFAFSTLTVTHRENQLTSRSIEGTHGPRAMVSFPLQLQSISMHAV